MKSPCRVTVEMPSSNMTEMDSAKSPASLGHGDSPETGQTLRLICFATGILLRNRQAADGQWRITSDIFGGKKRELPVGQLP